MRLVIAALLLFVGSSAMAEGPCPAGKRSLLILGTFHMQPSGQDAVERAEDMSSPRRQQEIEQLVAKLARFQSTKVAIESARNSSVWNDRYKQWLGGSYTMGMNETEQIGFRLARAMKLDALTPVDYPMWMNGLTPIERHTPRQTAAAAAPPPDPQREAALVAIRAEVARDSEHLRTHTLAEHLAWLNDPERAARNHRWDVLNNLRPADGVALYEKSDLAANWYKRNLRIFTNILEATSSEDRIVLIMGVGHVKILSDWAAEHPDVCLVRPRSYLE